MNASGAPLAERGEIYELCAVHSGAIVFKSCNRAGLDTPGESEESGRRAFFEDRSRAYSWRGKRIIGSVVGASEEEFIDVARTLHCAGAQYRRAEPGRRLRHEIGSAVRVLRAAQIAARQSSRRNRMRARGEGAAAHPVRAAHNPQTCSKSMVIAIAVCANDPPNHLSVDIASGAVQGHERTLSQAHAFFKESVKSDRRGRGGRNQHRSRRLHCALDGRKGGAGGVGPDEGRRGCVGSNRSPTGIHAGRAWTQISVRNRRQSSFLGSVLTRLDC